MEAQLQSLKVVDLKKLLQDAALPASGTKAELIKRLLENPSALSSLGGGSSNAATEEEDLLGENTTTASAPKQAAPAPAASVVPPAVKPKTTSTPAATNATPSSVVPVVEKNDEEKKAEVLAELEKRKQRAIKFGMPVEEIEGKIQRIQRFGLQEDQDSSIRVIDGELRGGKKGKNAKNGTTTGNGKHEQKPAATTKSAPVPVPIDPIEEEKKRKRAERFGVATVSEPSDKKVKT